MPKQRPRSIGVFLNWPAMTDNECLYCAFMTVAQL